jgi:hypothetical protein
MLFDVTRNMFSPVGRNLCFVSDVITCSSDFVSGKVDSSIVLRQSIASPLTNRILAGLSSLLNRLVYVTAHRFLFHTPPSFIATILAKLLHMWRPALIMYCDNMCTVLYVR